MAAKRTKTSIYTISKELSVSPSTVSRALNNSPVISLDVRKKVQSLVDKYSYQPRFVSREITNICLLVQRWKGHSLEFGKYVTQVMEGTAQYCQEEGLELSIYDGEAKISSSNDIVRELRRRMVDGVVILGATDESLFINDMNDQHFPYFCLDHQLEKTAERSLLFDNEEIAYMSAQHLLSLGHKSIGIICGSFHLTSVRARYNGYRRAFEDAGIEFKEKYCFSADPVPASHRNSMQLGVDGIDCLMTRVPEMTGVLAMDDDIAIGAMMRLQTIGISIPKKCSVVGISDYPDSAYSYPQLTTVRIPYKDAGYEAVRQVYRLVRGLDIHWDENTTKRMQPKLVIRNSTALPNK